MPMKLRVARATNRLAEICEMYRRGLDLRVLGSFRDHAGFDGVMLGDPDADHHLEFTQQAGQDAPRAVSAEALMVFYVPDVEVWQRRCDQMREAGFTPVPSHNPYWDEHGATFEDPEGYRVVLCRQDWPHD